VTHTDPASPLQTPTRRAEAHSRAGLASAEVQRPHRGTPPVKGMCVAAAVMIAFPCKIQNLNHNRRHSVTTAPGRADSSIVLALSDRRRQVAVTCL
jgi:hypothetical protein